MGCGIITHKTEEKRGVVYSTYHTPDQLQVLHKLIPGSINRADTAIIQLLIDQGADVNQQGGVYGNALQVASRWGCDEVVHLLIENGADVNALGGKYGHALQAASTEGDEAVVQLLIDNGADVNALGRKYRSALQAASAKGYKAVIKLLIDKAAAIKKHDEVVQLLIENGADTQRLEKAPGSDRTETERTLLNTVVKEKGSNVAVADKNELSSGLHSREQIFAIDGHKVKNLRLGVFGSFHPKKAVSGQAIVHENNTRKAKTQMDGKSLAEDCSLSAFGQLALQYSGVLACALQNKRSPKALHSSIALKNESSFVVSFVSKKYSREANTHHRQTPATNSVQETKRPNQNEQYPRGMHTVRRSDLRLRGLEFCVQVADTLVINNFRTAGKPPEKIADCLIFSRPANKRSKIRPSQPINLQHPALSNHITCRTYYQPVLS
ncbi:ankyrin repeat-containing domain protein [Mycena rebaudengoi]|nr:ankyrin repeat-containing domain protein [Mycena rebaudengoi]